jgi:DNA-binding MarR family transcriptional regulator
MVRSPAQQDYVDEIISVFADRHDNEVVQAKALAYRIRRLAHRIETEIKRELVPHGIELWELELLACLIRAEPEHRLSAGALMAQLQLTSGAVTNRVTRLEANGSVVRDFDPEDRRSVLVRLTSAGHRRAMEVFGVKTDAEDRLLSAFPPASRQQLNDELRTVLLTLEGPRSA